MITKSLIRLINVVKHIFIETVLFFIYEYSILKYVRLIILDYRKNDIFLYYVKNYFQKKWPFSTTVREKKNEYIDFLPIMWRVEWHKIIWYMMDLARVNTFLAWSNLRVRSTVLFWAMAQLCPAISYTITIKHISLDVAFHATSNENIFKSLW